MFLGEDVSHLHISTAMGDDWTLLFGKLCVCVCVRVCARACVTAK